MHPGSLASTARWQALQERGAALGLDWICKTAEPFSDNVIEPDGADGTDNRQKTMYTWASVSNQEVVRQSLIIALPRQLARYDGELGFVLLDGKLKLAPNDYQSTLLPGLSPDYEKMGSRQTSYQDHIRGLVEAYNKGIHDEISYIAHRLESEMNLPVGIIDQAVRLAIACHDLGKLDRRWQLWAREWQKLLWEHQGRSSYQLPTPFYCFAKTDNNYSRQQRELQRNVKYKRPHHACESAAIGRKLIAASLGITKTTGKEYLPVLRAICGAIARHHTSQASEYSTATLDANALKAADEALKIAHQEGNWSFNTSSLDTTITMGGDLSSATASNPKLTRPEWESGRLGELETWLYFVIVRALRLSDQRAG